MEDSPDLHDKRQATKRLVAYVEVHGQRLTMAEVARQTGIDIKTVSAITDDYWKAHAAQRIPVTPRVLGIDEVMVGRSYHLVMTNIETNHFFEILPGRKKEHFEAYFPTMPDKHKVEVVVTDLWSHYRSSVEHHFPGLPQVADRFHVVRMASTALTNARLSVRMRLKGPEHEAERLALKDERFVLLYRQQRLGEEDLETLADIKARYPLLAAAHDAKEGFYAIYDAPNRADAEALYAQWKASIDPTVQRWFGGVASTVDKWHRQIFDFFDLRVTNGYTESFNRFVKDTNRIGRGYTPERLRNRLLFNEHAQKIEWLKLRPRGTSQCGSATGADGTSGGAGSWGLTDAFAVPSVSRQRPVGRPTFEGDGEPCQREPNFPQIWESKIPHPGYASASSVLTRPAFNFSFIRYELPRMLSFTA